MSYHSIRLVLQSVVIVILSVPLGPGTSQGGTVWFTAPELRVAANDLARFISEKTGSKALVEIGGVDPEFAKGDWVLSDLVKSPPRVVEESLSQESRAYLQAGGQESFVAVNSNGIRHLVGGGHRGAVYASIRVQSSWVGSATPPLSVEFEEMRGLPTFKERLGGAGGPHPTEDYSQPRPADYDWETYARDLAHHAVNLTPAVINGQVVPDEVLKPWGIRKVLALSSNPFSQSDLRKWRVTQPNEVKPGEDPRHPELASANWMLCPGSEFARGKYKEWLTKALADHKTVSKVVFFLSDWGSIPGAECTPGAEQWQRVSVFLEEISRILKGVAPDAGVLLSTRGLAAEVLQHRLPEGVGLYFEEPSSSTLDPASAGYDPSLATLEWDSTYGSLLEQAIRERPDQVFPVIAAGDTDGTVSPAIGMALPNTTYSKVQRLIELKARHIGLEMGGVHPWVYSPNAEVFAEMIWSPSEPAEVLISRIAHRDFGDAGEELVGIWSLFDQAFALYPSICRAQRLERMVRDGGDLVLRAPTPSQVRNNPWSGSVNAAVPYLLESLPAVIKLWQEGLQRLQQIPQETEGEVAKDLRDSAFWGGFYVQLLTTQYNTIRVLNLLRWIPEGGSPEAAPWEEAFQPLYRDELVNCERWQDLLFTAPEPQIRLEKDSANATALARKLDQKRQVLEKLVGD